MTAFMTNAGDGSTYGFEMTCERDETVFVAAVFEDQNGDEIEFQTDNDADIREFFHQVDRAKADYERLTGEKLP